MCESHVRASHTPHPSPAADASPEATDEWPREAAADRKSASSTFLGPLHQVADPSPAVAPRPPGRGSSLELPSTKMEVLSPEDRPGEVTKGREPKVGELSGTLNAPVERRPARYTLSSPAPIFFDRRT